MKGGPFLVLAFLSLVLFLAFLFIFALWPFSALAQALEDGTGESEFKHQILAIFSPLLQPPLDSQDLAPVAYAGVNPFGVNTFFEQEVEEAKLRRSMMMLREAGVHWVRQQIPWSDIEIPAKGQYINPYGGSTWDKYDRIVALAQEYGLEMVARLDNPPPWSRQDNSVPQAPPDDLQDYGDFVYSFVQRYRGRIKYYQIWNEPNIYPEWGSRPVEAAEYVALLQVGYTRAKEADPEAVILSAALAPTVGTPDGRNESDLTFLQKMYDLGARDYFDIMSVMGYGLWTGPGDRRLDAERINFSRPQLIREIMVRNGDGQKPLWLAEVGWNALPPDFPTSPTHGRVTQEQQARYTKAAYQRAQREWPWVGVLFYWHFRMVSDENQDQVAYYFRMVDPDFTPYPVYGAYQELATSPPTLYRGYHQEDHWALDYQGPWQRRTDGRASLGGEVVGRPGATLSFTFEGTDLAVVTASAPTGGKAYITVDAYGANKLPRDQGQAYLSLTEREAWQVVLPVAEGLPQTRHRVTLRVAEGEVVVDALVVQSRSQYQIRLVLGVLIILGLVAAIWLLARRN